MKTNSQLIKKAKENGNYQNIYPIAYIDGIIDKESNEKLSDILIRYNHILVPWQGSVTATRNRVTLLMRRQGLWITYVDDNSEITTEVYKGSAQDIISNWADDVNWEIVPDVEYVQNNASKIPDGAILPQHLSKELQELLLSSGKVVNLPDGEDLTTQGIALKFKDREYNPELASGKGYKILRKNWTIVNSNNINLLTQDMISDSNTVYEIRYDFDLNGQTINIPEGCILKFEGGSVSNGTLNGDNTSILTDISYIFNSISFEGNWNVPFVYPEYFGAKGDEVTDDRKAIQESLDSSISNTVKLLQKTYLIKSYSTYEDSNYGIIVPTRKILLGSNTSNYTKDSKILISKDVDVFSFLKIKDRNITIKDLFIEGELKGDGSLIYAHGITTGVGNFAYVILENVKVKNCGRNGFDLGTYLSSVKLCNADTCGLYGFYIHGGPGKNTSTMVETCFANSCKQGGYYFDRMTYMSVNNCAADSCGFNANSLSNDNINSAYTIQECLGIVLNNCGCEQCLKVLKSLGNTRGLCINGGYFLLKANREDYPADFDFSKIIDLDWISNSSITNSLIGRVFTSEDNFKLITGTQNTSILIEDCYVCRNSQNDYTNFLGKYVNGDNITVINNVYYKVVDDAYIDNALQYEDSTIKKEVIIKAHYAQFDDNKYFNNIIGKLTLVPLDSLEINKAYSTSSMFITDCTDVNFNDFLLDFTLYNDSKNAIIITNSKVTFSNIEFIGPNESNKSLKMFELKNSTLVLNNWSFTPSYKMSEILGDYFLLDNSIVVLKNGNNIQYITDTHINNMINEDGTLASKVVII